MNRRLWQILPLTVALFATTVAAKDIAPADIRVLTKDTIVAHGETYRLVGFDTPETMQAQCPSERKLGYRATFRLRRIVAGGALDLEPVNCKEGHACRNPARARLKRRRDDGRQRLGASVQMQHCELPAAQRLVPRRDPRLAAWYAINRSTRPLNGDERSTSREPEKSTLLASKI